MTKPAATLKTFCIPKGDCLFIGTFSTGITVYSQQVRALNLAWALIETQMINAREMNGYASATDHAGLSIPSDANRSKLKVAIVGGGVAGLTLAAGLIAKGSDAEIYVFEERDTLLPMQLGSDTRWLHPRIYDWPRPQSEASVAMLPILNWTAARASDVAVEMLEEWRKTLLKHNAKQHVHVFCNAKHIQIAPRKDEDGKISIEYVAERRDSLDGMLLEVESSIAGSVEKFDIVILATGFGVENSHVTSYWRNDQFGQPSLHEPRQTFVISGQGDGAMVDLMRLCISQFRQDRIHLELFADNKELKREMEALYEKHYVNQTRGFFDSLERLRMSGKFDQPLYRLKRRLRHDTEVIFRTKVKKIAQLLDMSDRRISFQNRILLYLLFQSGGFIPSSLEEDLLQAKHGLPEARLIKRHGVEPQKALERVLSIELEDFKERAQVQDSDVLWDGGYFGYPGPKEAAENIKEENRESWRQEYLPGPTQLIASTFCASVAGTLQDKHTTEHRLRIALHRTMFVGKEEWLQQCCDYQGFGDKGKGAGRTFAARNAMIGQAYRTRRIVRSVKAVPAEALRSTMNDLRLHATARKMADTIKFLLAIPLLEPEKSYTAPWPVSGVLFIDSTNEKFFLNDDDVQSIVHMVDALIKRRLYSLQTQLFCATLAA